MSVFRVRRLGLCLLVVVLLLSVTVSAADSVVLVDSDHTTRFFNWVENIKDHTVSIYDQILWTNTQLENLESLFANAFFHDPGGADERSIATMLYSVEYFCTQFNRLLTGMETDLANIDEALRMTITSSNGTSTTYDMASIVYNHIGDKLDRLYNKLDSQSTTSSEFHTALEEFFEDYSVKLNRIDLSLRGSISGPLVGTNGVVRDIRNFLMNQEDMETKEAAKDGQQTFNSEFGSKDRTGDMSKLSGLSTGMTDWFSLPDVDITSMFDQVESGYGKWFTSETAQAISVGGGSAAVAAAAGIAVVSDAEYVEPETPYLDAWDQEVKDILAGGDGEW